MRLIFIGIFVAVTTLLGAGAAIAGNEPTSDADRAAIRGVISAQIEAFRADDGERAFSYASPDLRRMFRDPATFMHMVRTGYAAVYRPRDFSFLVTENVDGHLFQLVRVTGPDGRRVNAVYDMEREADGSWRINGCYIVQGEDDSV